MSTSYYRLKPPISSLRVELHGVHRKIHVVTVNAKDANDDMQVISEYGELTTVGAVKATAGAGRK